MSKKAKLITFISIGVVVVATIVYFAFFYKKGGTANGNYTWSPIYIPPSPPSDNPTEPLPD